MPKTYIGSLDQTAQQKEAAPDESTRAVYYYQIRRCDCNCIPVRCSTALRTRSSNAST